MAQIEVKVKLDLPPGVELSVAQGVSGGEGPRHRGGQAMSGKTHARAAGSRGNAPCGHGEGVWFGLQRAIPE
jgi:hypothetical protein